MNSVEYIGRLCLSYYSNGSFTSLEDAIEFALLEPKDSFNWFNGRLKPELSYFRKRDDEFALSGASFNDRLAEKQYPWSIYDNSIILSTPLDLKPEWIDPVFRTLDKFKHSNYEVANKLNELNRLHSRAV